MSHPITLPDVMPEIDQPTLLVVCDAHHCKLFDLGGHTMLAKEEIASAEPELKDRKDQSQSPGGVQFGVGDNSHVEEHRQKAFANVVIKRLEAIVREQGIKEIYLSCPGKFLSHLKKDLPKAMEPLVKSMIDGNFVKESPLALLVRFKPEMEQYVAELRDQENYSAKKHLPK